MQQVNLYLPEFRPRRLWLSLPQTLAAVAVALVLVVVASLWAQARTDTLEAEVAGEREQLAELQAEVDRLAAERDGGGGASVEERVAGLREDIRRRERLLALIRRQNLGNAQGFSAQLASLAERSSDQVALSGFSLQNGGQYVELTGRVRAPEAMPAYLQRLRQDDSFARTRFGVLELTRESDGPGLPFSLVRPGSEGEGDGDD